jgi:Mg-chelatase subunit ChlD
MVGVVAVMLLAAVVIVVFSIVLGGSCVMFLSLIRRVAGCGSSDSTTSKRKGKPGSHAPYKRCYSSAGGAKLANLPTVTAARGESQGMPQCKFLLTAKEHLARDYVLIIDRSGSMAGRNWAQAEEAVKTLAPYICRFDPDGVDVYFFDHEHVKFGGVSSDVEVKNIFNLHPPRGTTNLAGVLHAAFEAHFAGSRGATTILVITDGCPDSKPDVERVIKNAAASIERDAELSISFIQVGEDAGATRFLTRLDDDLDDAKFDIVDTVTSQQCQQMSFNELIANSIYD